jgi:hypothetical protein
MHHIHSYSALLQFLNNDIHVTLVCFRMLFISSTQKVVKEFLLVPTFDSTQDHDCSFI